MFRKENGVTLVALVITIIVLLILAGVTISMVLGDDGILNQASDATESYTKSEIKEKASIAAATVTTRYLADKYDEDGIVETENELTTANFLTAFNDLLPDGTEAETGSGDQVTVEISDITYTIDLTIEDGIAISVSEVSASSK